MTLLAGLGLCGQSALCAVKCNNVTPYGKELGVPVCEWRDQSVPTRGLIVALHGLTFYGGAFEYAATHLAAHGYPVYAYDLRGFGDWHKQSDTFPSDGKPHYEISVHDGQKLVELLNTSNPARKIFCLGESLGANMSLLVAAQEPDKISGLILSGLAVKQAWYPHLRWVKDVFNSLAFPDKPFDLAPYSKLYLSSDPSVVHTYFNDPNIYRQLTSVELIKALLFNGRVMKKLDRLPPSMPILVLCGGQWRFRI